MIANHYDVAKKLTLFLILLSVLVMMPTFAQQTPSPISTLSAADMIKRISEQIPSLMQMVTALAYVMGMYFIFYGVLKLKQYGEQRSMMTQEHQLKGPLTFIIVGAFLLYLPTSVQVGLSTFWTDPNPYGYVQNDDEWQQFFNACFLIVQLVGTIAFIRGLVLLSQLGGHAQPGTFARGITHIVGGVFCINIYEFVQVIFNTLGIQT
jgi:intracellular multiplication protein IcmC